MKAIMHTPGHWFTSRGYSSSPPVVLPILVVCKQGSRTRTLAIVVPDGKETDEDIVNATVMSRAPRMLALLHEARNMMLNMNGMDALALRQRIESLITDCRIEDE